MSRNKLLAALCALLCALWPLAGAASSTLIDPERIVADEVKYKTSVAAYGDLTRQISSNGGVYYPQTENVVYEGDQAAYVETLVKRNQEVKAGDPLVRVSIQYDAVTRAELELSLQRAREDTDAGVESRQEEIDDMMLAIARESDPYAREVMELRLKQARIRLTRYQRSQQYAIDGLQRRIEELDARRADEIIRAPVDGVVTETTYFKVGEPIWSGTQLCVIARQDVILVYAREARFRYGMPVSIEFGPARSRVSTTGRVVAAANVIGGLETDQVLILPDDPDVMRQAKMNNIVVRGNVIDLKNVLLIDRKAAVITGGKYLVTILTEDGVTHKRFVAHGMMPQQDGLWVLQGLNAGDTVIID